MLRYAANTAGTSTSEAITDSTTEYQSDRAVRAVRVMFWVATCVFGFLQTWRLRFFIDPDGNNYLDIASAYLRGDYQHAINAYWSPMYSWLIALGLGIFHPSGYSETTLLHLINFIGLLLALLSFEFFFRAFLVYMKTSTDFDLPMDGSFWWLLGYGLFFSDLFFVLTMQPTTPDIWVCAVSYLSMGILLRIALYQQNWRNFLALGFVLGLAYLTKAFYFPMAFVFLSAACFVGQGPRKNLVRILLSLLAFSVVAGPFIFVISKAKRRLTFGDVGNIAYAMFINPVEQITSWQGGDESGIAKHPTRQILANPVVLEFGSPVGGTYPPTYDLSYWADGVRAHFNLRGQLRILRQSVGTFFEIVLTQSEFAVGLLILLVSCSRRRQLVSIIMRNWPIWAPPLVACAAYSMVLTENRYVAPFIPFLWLALFVAAVSRSASKQTATAVLAGMLIFAAVKAGKNSVSDVLTSPSQRNINWEAALGLRQFGIMPGDKVAVIEAKAEAHWARLAGVKVVSELPLGQGKGFWAGGPVVRDKVFEAFAGTGSRAVIAKDPPPSAASDGWFRLGTTSYYARFLTPQLGSNHSNRD